MNKRNQRKTKSTILLYHFNYVAFYSPQSIDYEVLVKIKLNLTLNLAYKLVLKTAKH